MQLTMQLPKPIEEPAWAVTFPFKYLTKPLDPTTAARKIKAGKCMSFGCRRNRAGNKFRCNTCRSRIHRIRHELEYVFGTLRASAAKRGIDFRLTKKEFKEFCKVTGYLARRGQGEGYMTVDRIDSTRGYEADNIRILEWLENSSQGADFKPTPFDSNDDCPYG